MKEMTRWAAWLVAVLIVALPFVAGCGDDDDDDDDDEPPAWKFEIVDDEGDVGASNSLALDTSGVAHIAYLDADNQALKYATNKSGSWETQTLVTNDLVEGSTSIGVQDSGAAHISFCGTGLWYTNNLDGAFKSPSVLADDGCENDLAISPAGGVYIAYVRSGGVGYFGRHDQAQPWESNLIQEGTAHEVGIVVDAEKDVHVSYDNNGALEYANNSAGKFQNWVIDDAASGRFSSIAYGVDGVHVSYVDGAGALKYATDAAGTWGNLTVDDSAVESAPTSLALDAGGSVFISYTAGPALLFGTNYADVWELGSVDAKIGPGGAQSSVVVDDEGYVHISYYDANDELLKYAKSSQPYEYLDF